MPTALIALRQVGGWHSVCRLSDDNRRQRSFTERACATVLLARVSWTCLEPEDDAGQNDPGAVVDGFLTVLGGDPAPLFEAVEAAFDDVAALVGLWVEA